MHLRCLIVDDNEAFLGSASHLLESQGLSVVGLAASTVEAIRLVGTLSPDVVLVDIQLGDEDGLELTRLLAKHSPASRVVLISTRSADEVVELLEGNPAIGFLSKNELGAEAIGALLDQRAPR
jgi:DNA-binding NarL/FixJ family response regulator